DRRDPDGTARLAQLVVDVLCAQAAVLAAEEVDDRRPRAAAPVAGRVERLARIFRPAHRRECIVRPVITRIVLIIVCAAALTSGCGANMPASGKQTVVAAFYPLA